MASVLPPRKKDWKEGDHQVGLFIRFPNGATIEISDNAATPEATATAELLVKLLLGVKAKTEVAGG